MAQLADASTHLGREPEIDRLQRRLEAAVAGRGGLVVLRGPSGVGTTHTAHHVAGRADRLGMVALWGNCVEGLLDRPFGALAEALEELATGLEPDALREQLGAGAPALARMCPRMREVLPDIPPASPLDAADELMRLHDALLGWLTRASRARPTLLVIDDLQLADADTRGVLDRLLTATARLPLLVLGTWASDRGGEGSEGVEGGPLPEAAEVVDLGRLDEGAIGGLLSQIADRPVPPAALALIHEVSGGHPLFARELYRHLVEERRLHDGPGERPLPTAAEMPASVEDVVSWRVSRLPLEARTAISALACFAQGAPPQLLAEVSGLPRGRLVEELERAVGLGLARTTERGTRYVIAHDRVRRALLAPTPASVRRRVNGRAADVLEAELGPEARVHAALLAEHLLAAGTGASVESDRRLVRYLLVAAEQARAAYAYRRAVECLGHAVRAGTKLGTAAERADLSARLATAQAEAGLADESRATLRGLMEGYRRGGPLRAELWDQVILVLRTLHRADMVAEDGERATRADEPQASEANEPVRRLALDLAGARDELLRARLEVLGEAWQERQWAALRSLVWRLDEGRAAELLLDKSRDEADVADVLLAQRPRDARQTSDLLSRLRTWRRPPLVLRGMLAATVDLVTRLGMFREGAQQAARYLAGAERYGSLRDVALALLLLARCRAILGELTVADEILRAADDVLARIPPPTELAVERLVSELVLAHYRDGDWADLGERARVGASERARPHGLLLAAEGALGAARAGDDGSARELIGPLLDAAADLPPLTYARDSALLVALTAAWEVGAAEHIYAGRLLVERARAAGAGANHAASPRLALARVDALAGNVEDARLAMIAERDRLELAGMRPLRAIVDFDEAVALAAAGPAGYAQASALLDRAAEQFAALGMAGWVERASTLQVAGFEAASAPGGRLHFTYPAGLSRREADLVRLVAGGTGLDEVARRLDLAPDAVARHLASAMEKLGAASADEIPRLARRHGLGGGV